MSSVNKVILVGNLGKDPDVRYMQNGDAVTNISVATTETWKKDGERKEATEWHKVTFYRKLAEIAGEYLKQGKQVYIEGQLKTRKWQDKEGNDRYTTEIIATDMKMLGGGSNQSSPSQTKNSQTKAQPQSKFVPEDDDIPF